MAPRSRSNPEIRVSGPRWFNNDPGTLIGMGPQTTGFRNCDDHTGDGDCDPLTVKLRLTEGGVINRSVSTPNGCNFVDYICDWLRFTSNAADIFVSGVPLDVVLATNAAARTNPSRPYVDVPRAILDTEPEFRFGRRLRNRGYQLNRIIRRIGGGWLTWKFAVQPLVSELRRSFNVIDQVQRRVKEINRLYDRNGMRKTVQQGVFSASSKLNQTVQSSGMTISRPFDVLTSVRCWSHVRWAPSGRISLPSNAEIQALAERSVMVNSLIDFSTLWEITPWSWMADWFSNTSEYLATTRNTVPARIVALVTMKHGQTTWYSPAAAIDGGSITSIHVSRQQKLRRVGTVSPVAQFGFLNGNQMGILAALAASRV